MYVVIWVRKVIHSAMDLLRHPSLLQLEIQAVRTGQREAVAPAHVSPESPKAASGQPRGMMTQLVKCT